MINRKWKFNLTFKRWVYSASYIFGMRADVFWNEQITCVAESFNRPYHAGGLFNLNRLFRNTFV